MNINPLQLIQLIKGGYNPQQLLANILKQQKGNPIIENATSLAQQGNFSALESIARNLAKQRGLDFDKEFNNFKQYFN